MPEQVEVNIRHYVVDILTPLLPKKWALKPHAGQPDTPAKVTVLLSLKAYERDSKISGGTRTARWIFTVLEPKTDPGPADDDLDEDIITFLDALDVKAVRRTGLTWTKAERGLYRDTHPGFDIEITVPIPNKPEA